MHAQPLRHTPQAHHAHIIMYARVYTCTHCGRKSYLAQFCSDRINLSNTNVWVRNSTTPRDAKRDGYQSSHQLYVLMQLFVKACDILV